MKKVYIVDDDVDLVESMTILLQNSGYKVASQYDNDNLPENIRQFNPDVIILDVMFPDNKSAGFDMARTIRHHDDIKKTPIIMLTAVNQEGGLGVNFSGKDIDDMYLPITEFIEKPANHKVLIKIIEKLTA